MSEARAWHWGVDAAAPVVCATAAWNGLGFTPWQTWAFRRAELTCFVESPFRDANGKRVTMASAATLEPRWTGLDRLLRLGGATTERLASTAVTVPRDARVAVHVCLSERYGDGASARRRRERDAVAAHLASKLEDWGLAPRTEVHARGHASMAFALAAAGDAIAREALDVALVVGADTWHDPEALDRAMAEGRVFDGENLDSFVPGEGAAGVLLASPLAARRAGWDVLAELSSVAVGVEPAHARTELPCAGTGLSRTLLAVTDPLRAAGAAVDWWIGDLTTEEYRVHEFQLAFPRASAGVSRGDPALEFLPPLLGDLGAATLPTALAVAAEGFARGDPRATRCVCFASSVGVERGAVLLTYDATRDRRPRP